MRRRTRSFLVTSVAASALALGVASTAHAQGPSPGQVEEVVVTAQKREQNLQDVPAAVSAFGAESLQAQAVQNLTDLSAKVPNVVLAPVGAYPYASAFYIRGLGFADVESTFEPAVGVEMNGVYLARNSGALQDFFDIESVEILRGPQGTLYGRNTIGGVVSVRTKRPGTEVGGQVQLTVGDHGRAEARVALETPLNDVFAVRGTLLLKNYRGVTHNATTGATVGENEVAAGRVTLVARPSDEFDVTLVADVDRERGTGAAFRNASLPGDVFYHFSPDTGTPTPIVPPGDSNPADPYTIYGDTPLIANIDTWGLALTANWETRLGVVTSVTGYREFDDFVQSDYDASALNFFYAIRDQQHHQFSQEVRLASLPGSRLNYVVGAYYLDQGYDISNTQGGLLFRGARSAQIAGQDNTAWALFGQLDYEVTDALTLTAGGRYSEEEKTFTNQPLFFPTSRTYEARWDNFSPKLGVSYEFNSAVMAYGSWSKGFRSGGFNGRAASFTSAGPYDAETVESFEVGVKSELLDRRLRLNVAAFTNEYTDMQVGTQGLTTSGVVEPIITNAGKARFDGVEAEAVWIAGGGLQINANMAWLDARFIENVTDLTSDGVVNPTDNTDLPMAYAPEWSGSLGLEWRRDLPFGELIVAGNAVYMDDIYTAGGALNRISDVQVRKSNTLVDASAALDSESGWRVGVWVKNLTDEVVINNTFGLGALGNLRIYQPPRTWGVDLSLRF